VLKAVAQADCGESGTRDYDPTKLEWAAPVVRVVGDETKGAASMWMVSVHELRDGLRRGLVVEDALIVSRQEVHPSSLSSLRRGASVHLALLEEEES